MTIEQTKRKAHAANAKAKNDDLEGAILLYQSAIEEFREHLDAQVDVNDAGNVEIIKFYMICQKQMIICQINNGNYDEVINRSELTDNNSYFTIAEIPRQQFKSLKYDAIYRKVQSNNLSHNDSAIDLLQSIPDEDRTDDVKYALAKCLFDSEIDVPELKQMLIACKDSQDLETNNILSVYYMLSCVEDSQEHLAKAWEYTQGLNEEVNKDTMKHIGMNIIIAKVVSELEVNATIQEIMRSYSVSAQDVLDFIMQDYDGGAQNDTNNQNPIKTVLAIAKSDSDELKEDALDAVLSILRHRKGLSINDSANEWYKSFQAGEDAEIIGENIDTLNIDHFQFDDIA